MQLARDNYMYQMVRCELMDAVGAEFVNSGAADALGHSIDYYWIPEMWHDRGASRRGPTSWFIPVRPERSPRS